MDINISVKKGIAIRPLYLFFIIATLQSGIGIITDPRDIYLEAKQDSWLSILIAYLLLIIVLYVMFAILDRYENADIFGIQADIFGKWIGKTLGTIYVVYFFGSLFSILAAYIEVVQIFIFPEISSFLIVLLILFLALYAVLGGLRVIVGVCFLFFLLSQWLLILLYHPISSMDFDHLLPIFQTPIQQILKGAQVTTYPFAGFEILFLIYPFINDKKKAKLPSFLAITYTFLLLLISTLVAIGYFGLKSLETINWPVFTFFKSVTYSFVERLDYIVIVEWMMIIVPNNVLLLWGVTYGLNRLYNVSQRTTAYIASTILLILVSSIKSSHIIYSIQEWVSKIGFWIIFVYPLLLLPLVVWKKKREQAKGDEKNDKST